MIVNETILKKMDRIEVIPLKNGMSDDAYLNTLELANMRIAESIAFLPTLDETMEGQQPVSNVEHKNTA